MKLRSVVGVIGVIACFFVPAYSKCPVFDNTTLVVRATGDLQVDTTARERTTELQVEGTQVQENCTKDTVEYSSTTRTNPWKITTPKGIDLDLVTLGGNISVGDVDGD